MDLERINNSASRCNQSGRLPVQPVVSTQGLLPTCGVAPGDRATRAVPRLI